MNKLKNKVFLTIFIILSLTIIGLLSFFNIEAYLAKKNEVLSSLNIAVSNNDNTDKNDETPPLPKDDKETISNENIKYMDNIIYTILLDKDDNILDIINHSNNYVSNNTIKDITKSILSKRNLNEISIGNLYFTNYQYSYKEGEYLIIIDIKSINQMLQRYLLISIILLILLEIIVYIIAKIITKWIVKPVEEAFTRQKTFIADASHELKTPLSVIMASGESLKDNPKETKWIDHITCEAIRMNELITELLELASSEERLEKNYQNANLSKIIELASLTFEGKALLKNIEIDLDIEENIIIPLIESDIKQLIEILLDNAVKHSKEKENITIQLKSKNKEIELLVINKGDPIPSGEEEKIFERFYRVDKSRNRKENRYGLGLAIAKNIVTNHNGKITAMSKDGKTTFKVLLKK